MRLSKLVITGYRSAKGEETLITDDRITILIGANDHGKTNLLSAALCLNDDSSITPDDRHWDLPENSPVEIQWHFKLTDKEIDKIRPLAPKPLLPPPPESGKEPGPITPEPVLHRNYESSVVYSRDLATNKVRVASVPLNVAVSQEGEVLKMRPRVELFASPSGNVIDQVSLSQLESADFEFMQGIFRLAGLWEHRRAVFVQNDTTSRQLKQASETLTKTLNDRWNQGKELKWMFEHTGNGGDHIAIRIEDPAIRGRYTRPSLRSSGFKTYFLLSMIVYARTQNASSNSQIYLFDEPGTYLHPAAQLDLQRSFEAIADQAQIFYTTHSLFLVSKNYPSRNRVISKTKDGTKIDQKPFTRNWKSVRDSLGILLSNNFLIADKTLLVEGPSDAIYLLDALKKLKMRDVIDVDLNDISIVDAGSSQNFVAMAKLMLSEGRSVVALVDGDGGGEVLAKSLQKSCKAEIDSKKLNIHSLPAGKSSEDVFCNLDSLRDAARVAFQKLVDDGVRKAKVGLDINAVVGEIAHSANATLGRTLDDVTKTWFEPEGKISKLLISVLYEDEAEGEDLPAIATDEIRRLKKLLNLRSEKSERSGVFEDASA